MFRCIIAAIYNFGRWIDEKIIRMIERYLDDDDDDDDD